MQSNLDKNSIITIWILILSTYVIHLSLLWLPFINFEWAFADAAHYFETCNRALMDRYFSVQANTLGVPVLAFLVHKIIPVFDIGLAPRLVTVSGFLFLGSALIRLHKIIGTSINPALLAIIFLNPLVWTYGGRGTADFFPAALTLFSLSLFLEKQRNPLKLAAAILTFSIAIVTKYHALVFLPIVWLEMITRPDRKIKTTVLEISLITGAILVIPALYIYTIKHEFGFWLSPPIFQSICKLRLDFSYAVNNFVTYMGYLTLLLLPFSLLPLWRRSRTVHGIVKILSAAAVLFVTGWFLIVPNGEMGFGPLDAYFPNKHFIGGIFCLCAGTSFLIVKDGLASFRNNREAHRIFLCIMSGIFACIFVLSFTRPSNRYLLFVIPLGYLFIGPYLNKIKFFSAATICFFVLMNIYITINQYATGQAAIILTRKISENGLLPLTFPAVIIGHTGNQFPDVSWFDKSYCVIAGQSPQQLFYSESFPVPFIHKTFSIVPMKPIPAGTPTIIDPHG